MSPCDVTKWISSALMVSRSSPCTAERDALLACIFSRFIRFFSPGSSLPFFAPLTALRCCRLKLELTPVHSTPLTTCPTITAHCVPNCQKVIKYPTTKHQIPHNEATQLQHKAWCARQCQTCKTVPAVGYISCTKVAALTLCITCWRLLIEQHWIPFHQRQTVLHVCYHVINAHI